MGSRSYLLSKVLQAFLTLLFVLAVNFFLFRCWATRPTQLLRGGNGASRATVAQLEKQLGLDLPLPQQFAHYLGRRPGPPRLLLRQQRLGQHDDRRMRSGRRCC